MLYESMQEHFIANQQKNHKNIFIFVAQNVGVRASIRGKPGIHSIDANDALKRLTNLG